jgi:hypothetical protein
LSIEASVSSFAFDCLGAGSVLPRGHDRGDHQVLSQLQTLAASLLEAVSAFSPIPLVLQLVEGTFLFVVSLVLPRRLSSAAVVTVDVRAVPLHTHAFYGFAPLVVTLLPYAFARDGGNSYHRRTLGTENRSTLSIFEMYGDKRCCDVKSIVLEM